MGDTERAAAATARLERLERRPELERDAARQLHAIVVTLTDAGVVAERREAQFFAERLERMAGRITKWAEQDQKRLRRLHKGLRRSSPSSRVARAAVDAVLGELVAGGEQDRP